MRVEQGQGSSAEAADQTNTGDEGLPGLSSYRRERPWPAGHTPKTDCERELWRSFEDLRIDPGSHLTQQIVAERIGRSRTSISMGKGDGYELLRNAIKDEILRRKEARPAAEKKKAATKTPEERAARREGTINYYKDLEQRTASALIEANIRMVRAEQATELHKQALKAIFADLKTGKWVRSDGSDSDPVTSFQTFVAEVLTADAQPETGDEALAYGKAPRITGVKPPVHTGKPWRSYR